MLDLFTEIETRIVFLEGKEKTKMVVMAPHWGCLILNEFTVFVY